MKLKLEIEFGDDAMQTWTDARLAIQAALAVSTLGNNKPKLIDKGSIRTFNDNPAGTWEIVDDAGPVIIPFPTARVDDPDLYEGCVAALAYLADPPSKFAENRAEAVRIIRAAVKAADERTRLRGLAAATGDPANKPFAERLLAVVDRLTELYSEAAGL